MLSDAAHEYLNGCALSLQAQVVCAEYTKALITLHDIQSYLLDEVKDRDEKLPPERHFEELSSLRAWNYDRPPIPENPPYPVYPPALNDV